MAMTNHRECGLQLHRSGGAAHATDGFRGGSGKNMLVRD
jgi:hypothetical protein